MIAISGANGQLGQLVIQHLVTLIDKNQIVALVRNLDKATPLQALGVEVRQADYTQPATLQNALQGIDKLLLISSSEVGQRLPQHKNVIDAAKQAGVKLLAYTSILDAQNSPLALAEEHKGTEAYLQESGLPHVLLRNGWYTENYLAGVIPALKNGVMIGAAADGKISSAARSDYALAAAVVLSSAEEQAGKVYELAGDESYTLSDLCATLSELSGKEVSYVNMPQAEYAKALAGTGMPQAFADILADSDVGAAKGGLFNDSHTLSKLTGKPTIPLKTMLEGIL